MGARLSLSPSFYFSPESALWRYGYLSTVFSFFFKKTKIKLTADYKRRHSPQVLSPQSFAVDSGI